MALGDESDEAVGEVVELDGDVRASPGQVFFTSRSYDTPSNAFWVMHPFCRLSLFGHALRHAVIVGSPNGSECASSFCAHWRAQSYAAHGTRSFQSHIEWPSSSYCVHSPVPKSVKSFQPFEYPRPASNVVVGESKSWYARL